MIRHLALVAALAVVAPATAMAEDPPAAPAAKAAAAAPSPATTENVMVGEVIVLPFNRSAAYGPSRIQGPMINLTDTGGGEWKGNIRNLDGVFKVTESRISGGNFNMVMDRDGDGWTCQGTVDGKRVRMVMSPDGFVVRYDNRLYDMKRVAPDLYASQPTGPGLRVKGDAASATPYYPQFILALLAIL